MINQQSGDPLHGITLEQIVNYLNEQFGTSLVALEGANGKLDSTFFRTFPNPDKVRSLMARYMSQGEISGAAAASVTLSAKINFYGIENPELYERAIASFKTAQAEKDSWSEALRSTRETLDAFKDKYYSEKLKSYNLEYQKWQTDGENLLEFLNLLARELGAETLKTEHPQIYNAYQLSQEYENHHWSSAEERNRVHRVC